MEQANPVVVNTGSLAAAAPPDQAQRLAALRSYGILDTPIEGAFEDITRIASVVCQTPIAVVNLVDEHRQWFKSEIGLGVREMPLDTSFCVHALLQDEFLEIPDAELDTRFNHNPLSRAVHACDFMPARSSRRRKATRSVRCACWTTIPAS